jgi:hypothetical protein
MPLQPGEFHMFHSRLLHASAGMRKRIMAQTLRSRLLRRVTGAAIGFTDAKLTREEVTRWSIVLRVATPGFVFFFHIRRSAFACVSRAPERCRPIRSSSARNWA